MSSGALPCSRAPSARWSGERAPGHGVRLSVVVPVQGDAAGAAACLAALAPLRQRGHRVIAVSASPRLVSDPQALADRWIAAPAGWDRQCNAGSRAPEAETTDALLFLADHVQLPEDADRRVARALSGPAGHWGCFGVQYVREPFDGAAPSTLLRLASACANAGTRLTGLAHREQALFVTRAAFLAMEGFEDTGSDPAGQFPTRPRHLGRPLLLDPPVRVRVPARSDAAVLHAALRRERDRIVAALRPLA